MLAKGYILYYDGEIVCSSYDRDTLVLYLHQKGMRRLGWYYEVKRVPIKKMMEYDDQYILFEHKESGFILTSEDLDAYERRREMVKDSYKETLYGLQCFRDKLSKKKDKKKLTEAIEVLEKRKSILAGKEMDYNLLKEILQVDVKTIMEERDMFRQFHERCVREK